MNYDFAMVRGDVGIIVIMRCCHFLVSRPGGASVQRGENLIDFAFFWIRTREVVRNENLITAHELERENGG